MRIAQQTAWMLVLISALIACISAGWFSLAKVHYGFDHWYDFYEIEAHIDRYGPQNRYKPGLQELPPEQHIRLFNDISEAIHQHGEGLEDIRYDFRGRSITLLRQPEVVHLQDVANLIDVLRITALVAAAIALTGTVILARLKLTPQWRIQAGLLLLLIAGSFAVVMLIGPLEVFYFLHVHIFPEDHEWFFYYQDSLMATVMRAPVVFGGIAAAIAVLGLMFFIAYLFALKYFLRWQLGRKTGVIL